MQAYNMRNDLALYDMHRSQWQKHGREIKCVPDVLFAGVISSAKTPDLHPSVFQIKKIFSHLSDLMQINKKQSKPELNLDGAHGLPSITQSDY